MEGLRKPNILNRAKLEANVPETNFISGHDSLQVQAWDLLGAFYEGTTHLGVRH